MTMALLEARDELIERATYGINEFCDYRRAQGITWQAIEVHCGAMTVVPVRFFPGARFDFNDDEEGAHRALVMEVLDFDAETVIDLAAWPLHRPEKVASMFGRSPLLGMHNVSNAATYSFDKALVVHRSPLGWLQAGGGGCAIVVPALAAHVLNDAPGKVSGEDAEHAREIGRLVSSIVDLGKIVAPLQPMRRAAA
jgi:hypothetical protein